MFFTEITVFWIGAIIFLFSTLFFLISHKSKDANRFLATSDIFVSFLTTISYVVMASAIATILSPYGEFIYWSRWLFYAASCSILALDVAVVFGKNSISDFFETSVLASLVMFCGFLASYVTGLEKWMFFGLSSGAYMGLLYILFSNVDYKANSSRRLIMWWIVIFWSLFPVIWILAPTGFGLVSTFIESIGYLILDVITKIAFGLFLVYKYRDS